MRAIFVNENIGFERYSNPKEKMKLGKYNPDLWRKKYNNKPIMEAVAYIKGEYGDNLRYELPIKYQSDWEGYPDTLWIGQEKLFEGNLQIPISSINKNYTDIFGEENDEERTLYNNQELFEREWIVNLVNNNAEIPFKDWTSEMWEDTSFEKLIYEWVSNSKSSVLGFDYISL